MLAGMNANVCEVAEAIQALVRSGQPVEVGRLTDPDLPLAQLAAELTGGQGMTP